MTQTQTDPTLRRTLRAVLLCGVLLAVGSAWQFGTSAGLSVVFGSGLAFANLLVLQRTVANLMAGVSKAWTAVAFLKFIVLFGATYFLVTTNAAQPLYLAVGFGSLPLGIVIATIIAPFFSPPGSSEEADSPASELNQAVHSDSNEGQKNDSLHLHSGHSVRGALSGSHGDLHA